MKFETQNLFFTSDTHFGHKNVIKYSNRPFTDVEQMNRKMIENFNSQVGVNDHLFFLGDFIFGKPKQAVNILNQIACQNKYLIMGNHDEGIMDDPKVMECFKLVTNYLEIKVKDGDFEKGYQKLILFHFPILEWHSCSKGSGALHGHTHGNLTYPKELQDKRIMDVGVDCNNYYTFSYKQIKEGWKNKKALTHHGN